MYPGTLASPGAPGGGGGAGICCVLTVMKPDTCCAVRMCDSSSDVVEARSTSGASGGSGGNGDGGDVGAPGGDTGGAPGEGDATGGGAEGGSKTTSQVPHVTRHLTTNSVLPPIEAAIEPNGSQPEIPMAWNCATAEASIAHVYVIVWPLSCPTMLHDESSTHGALTPSAIGGALGG